VLGRSYSLRFVVVRFGFGRYVLVYFNTLSAYFTCSVCSLVTCVLLTTPPRHPLHTETEYAESSNQRRFINIPQAVVPQSQTLNKAACRLKCVPSCSTNLAISPFGTSARRSDIGARLVVPPNGNPAMVFMCRGAFTFHCPLAELLRTMA
jgi:hypothetical protein